ncbi:uncharacterized protein ATC70_009946 [Mucor velutinosus]|uniref:E2F/DP family winged-helix DNA-binding domain-containing protein n=1 Tax=Mucor velutinosus TaxID=708070 RepID=A0AAN7DLR7_9FUNG|nr:hypothetical protein ATC70_009946 [Mucor velutinosus]
MTSSVSNNNNNNNNAVMISSLPSPPISNRQSIIKMPAFMLGRVPPACPIIPPPLPFKQHCSNNRSAGGWVSDMGSTSYHRNSRQQDELRPLLYQQQQDECYLPPIQNFMNTPLSSPSPPPSSGTSCCYSSSPSSSSDEDDVLNSSVRRKGSIASLLNSDPELKQLDEEESKCNYQSHFFDNYSLKRGRPSTAATIDDTMSSSSNPHKKQRTSENADCIKQACQSSKSPTASSYNTFANESTRATKGLRHFSKQVCDKVAKKGVTTYNEVADELAFDIQQQNALVDGQPKQTYDQKNIRRRVYDALNVLMAMNIITKDKKVIKWLGIPECYKQPTEKDGQDNADLLSQIKAEELRQHQLLESLQVLRGTINSKLEKHVHIRNLVSRNQSQPPSTTSQKIELPFFMICSSLTKDAHLQLNIQNGGRSAIVSFQHDQGNQQIVYEDMDVLRHVSLLL